MADTKITALAAITTVDPAADVLPIVDISDTSMAASGTTKKITSNQILGAGGTATLASATITGDLTVDTSTLKVDSTNNRVGIGTATPGAPLHIQSATATFKLESSTGTNPAYLYATSTGGDFYFGRDNSTGTTFGTGTGYSAVVYSSNAYPMVFFTNAIERARITSSGDVNITTGNLVMGTSGKGIDFSATSGIGTSEILADYEEGTWSPTVGSNVNLTSVTAVSALYTKVGRLVTITGTVTATVTSANSLTYFTLLTLPFANNGTTTGAVQENGNLTIGAIQVASSNLYGLFPAASAVVSGAATFNYSVTYTV